MQMKRFTSRLAAAGLLLMLVAAAQAAERVALVVGNAAYEQEIAALKNPGNDAAAVAAALRRLGFEVLEGRDLDEDAFYAKVTAFEKAAEVPKTRGQLQSCTCDGIRFPWSAWENPRASFS